MYIRIRNKRLLTVRKLRGVELDNLIFEYQQMDDLTDEEFNLLLKADVAYIQDLEELAAEYMELLVESKEFKKKFCSIKGTVR